MTRLGKYTLVARSCIYIYRAFSLHIMADICDCHQQTPTIFSIDFQWLTVNGVIKIFGVFAIDSDQRNIR
jgi:hypothetical protein